MMCHALFAVRLFDDVAVLAAGPASVEAGAKLHAESEVSRRSANHAAVLSVGPGRWRTVLC